MLRSISDVNAPKFLAPDIVLFNGILSDLFPGARMLKSQIARPLMPALEQESLAPRGMRFFTCCPCACVAPRNLPLQFVAGVELPPPDYADLDAALAAACGRAGLQAPAPFLAKAKQLYEMILVRQAFKAATGVGVGCVQLGSCSCPVNLCHTCCKHVSPALCTHANAPGQVRHGLMLVGLSYGAKTCLYK